MSQRVVTNSIVFIFSIFLALPFSVHAQSNAQVLTVTPPLFQLSVERGDIWQSSVKVVNGNPYEITVYAEVVNFAASGESGQGKFIPVLEDEDESRNTLAEWIEIANGPYVIPPEQSRELSFFVEIPKDAPPGGHFAAILVGTQPPKNSEAKLQLLTSQTITSLFFVRIEGDVTELGSVREFRVLDSIVDTPEAEFSLRFENKGNVHLQPRGHIVITNMWGTERGLIPINNQSHFGNVLPKSIRDFRFTWKGEGSVTEIGRYKAIVTLAYGENGVKSTDAVTYFWVIPVKATLITLSIVIAFILLVTWMIKLYIRRMLALAGVHPEESNNEREETLEIKKQPARLVSYRAVSAPIRSGAADLRGRLSRVTEFLDVLSTIWTFIVHYKMFFISVALLIVGFVGAVLYISDASQPERDYEITIKEGDGERKLSDDEVKANFETQPVIPSPTSE